MEISDPPTDSSRRETRIILRPRCSQMRAAESQASRPCCGFGRVIATTQGWKMALQVSAGRETCFTTSTIAMIRSSCFELPGNGSLAGPFLSCPFWCTQLCSSGSNLEVSCLVQLYNTNGDRAHRLLQSSVTFSLVVLL